METPRFLERCCRVAFFLVVATAFFALSGCVSMMRVDGPYEGRVVDAETLSPIEGAVVVGAWYKVDITPAGRYSRDYDSKEVLTDRNGEFRIEGKGLLVLSGVDGMVLTLFKAGYEQFPRHSYWWGLQKYGPFDKVSWKDGKGTFKLKRLTLEERQHRVVDLPVSDVSKEKKLIRERNKEMIEIGFPSNTLLPEGENE